MSGQETREKILSSARALFVEHGFTGTSIGKIAKDAGVNHSLVFHHFQNKGALWMEVKLAIVTEAKERESTLPSHDLPFQTFITQMVHQVSRFYQNNPDIVRMIQWQRLDVDQSNRIGITPSVESSRWVEAFSHYQKKGEMTPSIKPSYALTYSLSVISAAALDYNAYLDEGEKEGYLSFCVDALYKTFAQKESPKRLFATV
ncbi:MAG: TetR family transcriptional regulator [Alphaproteobacteria bacterium]|nr:TetR family transcriptional regulator [Alphaproteobacteria bacterium]